MSNEKTFQLRFWTPLSIIPPIPAALPMGLFSIMSPQDLLSTEPLFWFIRPCKRLVHGLSACKALDASLRWPCQPPSPKVPSWVLHLDKVPREKNQEFLYLVWDNSQQKGKINLFVETAVNNMYSHHRVLLNATKNHLMTRNGEKTYLKHVQQSNCTTTH